MNTTRSSTPRIALALLISVGFACAESTTEPPPIESARCPECEPSGRAAHDALAAMDHRQAVPLQPMMAWHQKQNMMEHLVAIQRITAALAVEDWSAVGDAAALIESSPQMQQMCQHMGAGAPGFTDMALDFHRRADAIGVAADEQDGPAVLRATAHTLEACTSCHAAYRQELVDAATWQERTGSNHDPSIQHPPMHEHGSTQPN